VKEQVAFQIHEVICILDIWEWRLGRRMAKRRYLLRRLEVWEPCWVQLGRFGGTEEKLKSMGEEHHLARILLVSLARGGMSLVAYLRT